MDKKRLCNIALIVLCGIGLIANHCSEQYKMISIACMLGMAVIALVKDRLKS